MIRRRFVAPNFLPILEGSVLCIAERWSWASLAGIFPGTRCFHENLDGPPLNNWAPPSVPYARSEGGLADSRKECRSTSMTHTPPPPLVVNFTPTGMVPTKAATPHVPVSPAEIVEQVHEA